MLSASMLFTLSLVARLLQMALCDFFEITDQAGSDSLKLSEEAFQCNMNNSCKVVAKQKNGTVFKFFESDLRIGNNFDVVWKKMPEKSFLIRHVAGRCLGAASKDTQIIFTSSCNDRFVFTDNNNLKHVNSGFCVERHGNDLYLTGSCDDPTTQYTHTAGKSLLQITTGKCIHPSYGHRKPREGLKVVLWAACELDYIVFDLIWS